MVKRKIGSFFDKIIEKSGDTAEKLRRRSGTKDKAHIEQTTKPSQPTGTQPEVRHTNPQPKQQSVLKASVPPTGSNIDTEPTALESVKGSAPAAKLSPDKNAGLFSKETQFSDGKKERTADVIIGLDFGTSCSKAVIHVPYDAGGPAFVIPFLPFANADYPQLIPTHLSQSPTGEYLITDDGELAEFDNLKLALMQKTRGKISDEKKIVSAECERTIAYLALILKFVRQWFLTEQEIAFRHLQLNWHVNIGVPSATFDDSDVYDLFRHLLACAWLVSTTDEAVTSDGIKGWAELQCSNPSDDRMQDLGGHDVFPEVAAEVAGYAVSKLRNEGLHLLVDIGAGTFDVCGFVLFEDDGQDKYPLLTAEVNSLGAAILDRCRKHAIRGAIENWFKESRVAKTATHPIPDDPTAYVPKEALINGAFNSAEDDFSEKCRSQVRRVVAALKARRDPLSSRWRTEGLPVFVCGGGRDLRIHQSLVDDLSEWLKESFSVKGAKEIQIPKPDNLRGEMGKTNYQRLAVAWGLSQPSVDIGECISPKDIEDIDPKNPSGQPKDEVPWWRHESSFVGAEHM